MNLYFRLLLFILRLPFIKVDTHAALPTSEMQFRVLPNDIDFNWHMNNSRYLSLMDFGRFHLIAKMGIFGKIFKKGWSPAVGAIKIIFIKALKPWQKYRLITTIVYWDEKWIYMQQDFMVGEQLMATALAKALFTHKGKKIPSAELIALSGHAVTPPPLPENVRKWREADAN